MNRVPDTNGRAAESMRARGGYDAYLAPLAETQAAVSTDSTTTSDDPEPAPEWRLPTRDPGATLVGSKTTPGSDPEAGAEPSSPAPPRVTADAEGSTTAGLAVSGSPTGAGFGQANSRARQPDPAAAHTADQAGTAKYSAAAYHPGVYRTSDSASAAGGAREGRSHAGSDSAPSSSTAGTTQESRAASTSWSGTQATPESWPHSAPGQANTASRTEYLPDRIGRVDPADRVEVLPATLTSIDLLADITAARRAELKSTSGMRGALNKVGFNLGLSPAEQRTEHRRARIRRQLNQPYQIAVISVKGGVGRTTVAATLGSTFSSLRPDRVVAVDANPDFGDLPARTAAHPYGLTLRDMAQANNIDAFSAVHSFTSINTADLATLASPWNTEAVEALSGAEFAAATDILRKHFNLLVIDCGTGVLDSITQMVLRTSDAIVVVTPPTVGGVKGAVATLNWLNSHGLQHLIASSRVAIVHQQPAKPTVEVEQIEKLFATAQRPTDVLPYDEHLAEGGEVDLRLLDKDTQLSFEELAAGLGDGFPGHPGAAERGGRR